MELKDGSGSDSFSPSIWSLRQFIWFGLDLLLSSGSLWLWLAGRSSQRGLLYSFNVDVAIVCVEDQPIAVCNKIFTTCCLGGVLHGELRRRLD
ncbi:transmembrane protein [Arabidopsis thaliana]|uniref:Transmembrane protein n=1 Tax=Arabidopsis thaliana TaxID=3702 RepID=Q6DSS7_ARATH|nr:uncharacterized protein AT2G10608 [Arabidopsis thaliana]AAT68732.1 hypothetical protein At2g10608 [Arabidopsis thaliana]AEC06152.1 transmembrane protein [Arabidopsis thaliana]|eukprot:NP_973445.2 transmembrane protein [Arabidopsis thaliana]